MALRFKGYDEAISYLDRFQFHGFRLGLERIEAVLKELGDPQKAYPCIHVAGTNGKGSVCAALSCVLEEAGLRVGFYSSPHLYRLNERFRLDMEQVSDKELVQLISDIACLVEQGFELSYFEFTTAMAFSWFARKEVDIAIIETGLGGRLDATNVVIPKVSVITNISLEHQAYLGTSLGDIAYEKAGIIKTGVPVVIGDVVREASSVLMEVAARKMAPVIAFDRDFHIVQRPRCIFDYSGARLELQGLSFGLYGGHQLSNAAVCLAAIEELITQGVDIGENAIRCGLSRTFWPGRSELFVKEGRKVFFDGAHNMAGVVALKKLLLACRSDRLLPERMSLLWACSDEGGDKDISGLLREIAPLFQQIVITEPVGPRRPVTIEQWQAAAWRFNAGLEKEWETALACLLEDMGEHSLLVVSGSLYLIGPVRKRLMDQGFVRIPFDGVR